MERAGGWRGVIAGLVLLALLLASLRCVERTRLSHDSGSQPVRAALLYVSEGLSPVATSVALVLQLLGPSSRRTRALRRVTAVLPTALALARGFIEDPTLEVRDSSSVLGSLTSAALVAFNEEAPTTAAIHCAVLFIASASNTFIRFVRQALLLHSLQQQHQHQQLLAWASQPSPVSLPNGSIPASAAAAAAAAPTGDTPAQIPTFTPHPADLQHLAGALVMRILALALVHGLAVVLVPLLAQQPEVGPAPGGSHSLLSGAQQSSAHGTVQGGPEAGPVTKAGSTAGLVPHRETWEAPRHQDAQAVSTNPDGNMATPFLTAVPLSSASCAQAVAVAGHPAEPQGPSSTPPHAQVRDPHSRQRPSFNWPVPHSGLVSAVQRIPSGPGAPHPVHSHPHHLPPLVGPTGPVSDWHVAFVRLLDAVLMLLHYLAAPGCPGVHPAGLRTAPLHLGYGSTSFSDAGAGEDGAAQGAGLSGSVCTGSGGAAAGARGALAAVGGEEGLRSALLCLAALLVATWGASVQLLDAVWALWPGRHRAGLPLYCLANTTATWCSAAARVAVLLLLGARGHGRAGARAGGCAAGESPDAGGGPAVAMAAVMLMNLSANGDQAGSYALQCAAALACTAFMHWRLEPHMPGTALAMLYGGLYGCALCLLWVMARARRLAQQRALQQVLKHHRRALQARQQLQAEQKRTHQVLGWAAGAAPAPPSPLQHLSFIPSLRDSRLPFYRSDPAVRRQPSAPLAQHNPARSHSTFPNSPSPLGPTPPSHSPIPSPVLSPNPPGMLPSGAQPYAADAWPDPTAPPPSCALAQALMTTSSSVAGSQPMSPGGSGHVATTDGLTTVQTSSRRSTADVAVSQRSSFDVGLPPRWVETAAGATEASAAADPHRTSGDGKGRRPRAEADAGRAALLPPRQRSAPQHQIKVPPGKAYPPQPTWPPGAAVPSPAHTADSPGLYGRGPSPFATAPVILASQGRLHTAAMRRSSANASGPAARSSLLASSPAVHESASLPLQVLPHGTRPAAGYDVHGVYGPGGGAGQRPRRTVSDQDRRHTQGHVRSGHSHPAGQPGVGPEPLGGNAGQLLPVTSSAASLPLQHVAAGQAVAQGIGAQHAEQAPELATSQQQPQHVKWTPKESTSVASGPHAAPDGTQDTGTRAVLPVVGMPASSEPSVQGPGVTGTAGSAPNASGAEIAQDAATAASASSRRAQHRISQVQPNVNASLLQEHSSSAATGGQDQSAGASSQSLAVGAAAAEQPGGMLRASTAPPLGLAPSARSGGGGSSIPLPPAGTGTGSNAVFSSTLLDADMYDRLLSSASSPFLLGPNYNRNNSALNTQPLNQSPNITQQLRTNAYTRQSSGLSDGYPHSIPIPAVPGPGTGAGVGVTLGGESSPASRSSANATAAAAAAVQRGRPAPGDHYRRQGSTGQGTGAQGLTLHGGSFRWAAQDDGAYAPGPSSEPGRRARVKSRAPRQVITLPDGRQVYQSETLAAAASSSTATSGATAAGGGTVGSASALSSLQNDRVADVHMLSGGTVAHLSPAAAVAQADQAASYFSRSSYGVGSQANGGLSSQDHGTPRSPVGWALDSERQGRYNSGSIMTSNAYYNYQPLTNPNSTAATNAHMSTTMTDSWRFLMSSHHSQPASGAVVHAASSSSAPPPPAGAAAAGAPAPHFGQGMPAASAAAAYGSSSGGGAAAPGPTATVETLSVHMTMTSRTTASSSRFGSVSTAGQITGATPTTTAGTLFNTADSGAAMRGFAAAGGSSTNPSAGRTSSVMYNLRGSLELARHLHDTGLIRIGEEDGGGSGEDATGSSSWRLHTSGGVGGGDGSGRRGSGTHTGEAARSAGGEQAVGGVGIVDRVLNRFFNRGGVGGAAAGAAGGGGGGGRKLRPEVRGPPWRTAGAGNPDSAGLHGAGTPQAQSPRGPQWDGANLMDEQQQRLQQYVRVRDRSGEGAGAEVQLAAAPEDTHPPVQQLLVQGGKLVATSVHGEGGQAAGGPTRGAHRLAAAADMLGELYAHDPFAISPQGVPAAPTTTPASAFAAAAAHSAGGGGSVGALHGPAAAAAAPLPPHDSGSGRRSHFTSGPGRTILNSIPSGDFPDSDSGGTAVTAAPASPFVQRSSPVSPALPPQPNAATHLPAIDGSSGPGQVMGPESAPLSDFTLHALLNSHNGVTSSEALAQVTHGPASAGAGYVPTNSSANGRTGGSVGGSQLSSSELVSFADVTLGSVVAAGERGGGAHAATAGRTGSGSGGSNAQAPPSGATRKASGSRRAVRAQTLALMASHGSIARGQQLPAAPGSGNSPDGVAGGPEAGAGAGRSPGPASANTGRGVQLLSSAAVAVAVAVGSKPSRRGVQREGPAGGHPEGGPLRSTEGSSTASVTFPTLMGPVAAVGHAGVGGAGGYPAAVSSSSFEAVKDASLPLLSVVMDAVPHAQEQPPLLKPQAQLPVGDDGRQPVLSHGSSAAGQMGGGGTGGSSPWLGLFGRGKAPSVTGTSDHAASAKGHAGGVGAGQQKAPVSRTGSSGEQPQPPLHSNSPPLAHVEDTARLSRALKGLRKRIKTGVGKLAGRS